MRKGEIRKNITFGKLFICCQCSLKYSENGIQAVGKFSYVQAILGICFRNLNDNTAKLSMMTFAN